MGEKELSPQRVSEEQKALSGGNIDPELLLEAFATFTQTSAALEKSYLELQEQVRRLNLELESKNRSLEESLKETERVSTHLSTVLSCMRDGVLAYNLEGEITLANYSAAAFLNSEPANLVGRKLVDALESALGFLPAPVEDETFVGQCECHIEKGEKPMVLQIERHPLMGPENEMIGQMLTLEDITYTTFARAQSERNERLAAMGKMAVNIVHEIRNPMGSIQLLASLLRRDLVDDPPKMDIAERISTGISTMNHVIENLLVFARDKRPTFSSRNVREVVEDTLRIIEPMARRQNVRLVRDFDETVSDLVCDGELIKQALLNIMLNGLQAMENGGELSVGLFRREQLDYDSGRPNHFVQFKVGDTGPGIPADVKARIFDPFYTTKEKGTGLGLALVHKIIRAHGGFVDVDSKPAEGAVFMLNLPVKPVRESIDE